MKKLSTYFLFAVCVIAIISVFSYSHNKFSRLEKKIAGWSEQTRDFRYRSDLLAVRQFILSLDPTVAIAVESRDRLKLAETLRRHVYKGVPRRSQGPEDQASASLFWYYKSAVCDPEAGYLCQGTGQAYMIALEAFGIPTRRVDMFSSTSHDYFGHSSIEIHVDGRWFASDPSFDISFRADGRYLSWEELRSRLLSGEMIGEEIEVVGNDSYDMPPELVRYMIIYPARVSRLGDETYFDLKIVPNTWNGKIAEKNGEMMDVVLRGADRVDRILSNGPLR